MAPVSNTDLAQQLGEVQGSLKHLIRDSEQARTDRGRLFERVDRVEQTTAAAASAASMAARTAADAVSHIERMQKELAETIQPAIRDYLTDKPVIDEYKHLRAKAAGVALALLFLGGVAIEVFRVFLDDIRRWLGW